MLPIQKKFINYNISKRSQKPIYIVVHDTGNSNPGSDALAHFNYFNGGNRGASADYFVDDHQIIQTVDYNVNYSWHCGDGKGIYGILNANSIGVELCINSDGNYDQTLNNGIELVAYLSKELGIDMDHIVRHYDASRKNCPGTMSLNNWEKWASFKSKIRDLISGGVHVSPPIQENPPELINQPVTLIRQGDRGPQVAEIQAKLLKLGFDPKGVDGIFGPNTLAAVKAFQASRHIGVDGIVGPQTLGELDKPNPIVAPPPPPPPPPQPKIYSGRLLKQGCRGDDVKRLQSLLGGLVADGIFGPLTKSKVMQFQRSHGLAIDGIVGQQTGTALKL